MGSVPGSISGLRFWFAVAVVYKPAAAAPIRPLAWELSYAAGKALKIKKKKELIFHMLGKQTYGYQRGEVAGGMDCRFGIGKCPLLYVEQMVNGALLHSTENSTQYSENLYGKRI